MSAHLDYEINKELGECYLFMGELDKAESYYHKAANSNGIHPDPYLGLATIAVQRGNLDQAMALYSKAEGISSSHKSLAGMALIAMQQGETAHAFELHARALALKPDNLISLFGLVQAAHVLERPADALEPLVRYLEIYPDKSEVRYALAGCLVASGDTAEARDQAEKLLEMDPGYERARELLAQI